MEVFGAGGKQHSSLSPEMGRNGCDEKVQSEGIPLPCRTKAESLGGTDAVRIPNRTF